MLITTTLSKPKVEVYTNGDIVMRRGVDKKEDIDVLTGTVSTLWVYDQVKFNIPYTSTLQKQIESQFDKWFKIGQAQEKATLDKETRQQEARVLLKEGEQPKINKALNYKTDTGFDALTEIYEQIMDLQQQIDELKGKITI